MERTAKHEVLHFMPSGDSKLQNIQRELFVLNSKKAERNCIVIEWQYRLCGGTCIDNNWIAVDN